MSKRILVVEDQEDNRQIIRDLLAATDYELSEAENGEEALAAVARPATASVKPNRPRIRRNASKAAAAVEFFVLTVAAAVSCRKIAGRSIKMEACAVRGVVRSWFAISRRPNWGARSGRHRELRIWCEMIVRLLNTFASRLCRAARGRRPARAHRQYTARLLPSRCLNATERIAAGKREHRSVQPLPAILRKAVAYKRP
jgi:CheY-like chemotaxis protein